MVLRPRGEVCARTYTHQRHGLMCSDEELVDELLCPRHSLRTRHERSLRHWVKRTWLASTKVLVFGASFTKLVRVSSSNERLVPPTTEHALETRSTAEQATLAPCFFVPYIIRSEATSLGQRTVRSPPRGSSWRHQIGANKREAIRRAKLRRRSLVTVLRTLASPLRSVLRSAVIRQET